MSQYKLYVAGAIALIVAFSAGRFSSPIQTKTVIQEKIVYVEKKDDTKSKDTVTHTTQTKKPDGTVVTVTDKETKTNEHSTTTIDQTISSTKTSSLESRPDWRLGLSYNPGLPSIQSQRYEVSIQRRIISEVYLGVNASTDRSFGVNLSIGF